MRQIILGLLSREERQNLFTFTEYEYVCSFMLRGVTCNCHEFGDKVHDTSVALYQIHLAIQESICANSSNSSENLLSLSVE